MALIRKAGDFDRSYEEDMRIIRKPSHALLAILGIIVAFALPQLSKGEIAPTFIRLAYTIIALQGLNLLVGYAGQISLGQAAFMLIGGYSSGLLMTHFNLPILLTIFLAALITGAIGLLFGLPALRVKGFYLAMATLAAQFIIPWMTKNMWRETLGGANGTIDVPVPSMFGFEFRDADFFWLAFPILLLTTVLTNNVTRTKLGRAFVSLRDNDLAAELLGVNLFGYKLRAFFFASALAGVAGALRAHYQRGVGTEWGYTLNESIIFLGMLVIGGLGTRLGPYLGAFTLIYIDEFATWLGATLAGTEIFADQSAQLLTSFRPIFFGIVLMLFLVFEPRGLAHRWQLLRASWRLRPFAR